MDPITASLIVGGTQAGSGYMTNRANRKSQEKQNQLDRDFSREMYDKQRTDAIEDWNRQNEYNHPSQQMERLREAGLNPNLVYGKGADNTATSVARSSPITSSQPAPKYNDALSPALQAGLNTISMYQQVKQSQAQTDNLNKQAALIQADTALRESQAQTEQSRKVGQDLQNIQYGKQNNLLDFDFNQKLRLADINVQSAVLDNEIKNQALALNMDKFELQKLESAGNRKLVYEQMLKTKEERLAKEIDNDIARNTKEETIRYKKMELDVLRQNLRNLEKTGRLLDNQDIDFQIDHEIKVARKAQIEKETEYTQEKIDSHWLEVGGRAFRIPNINKSRSVKNVYIKK